MSAASAPVRSGTPDSHTSALFSLKPSSLGDHYVYCLTLKARDLSMLFSALLSAPRTTLAHSWCSINVC